MKHTPEPWVYRPNEFDDWGFVRDEIGNLCAVARCTHITPEEVVSGKDPYKANGERIVACVNAFAGIEDPVAFVAKAKKAIQLCKKFAILNEAHYKDIAGFILEARTISTEEQK